MCIISCNHSFILSFFAITLGSLQLRALPGGRRPLGYHIWRRGENFDGDGNSWFAIILRPQQRRLEFVRFTAEVLLSGQRGDRGRQEEVDLAYCLRPCNVPSPPQSSSVFSSTLESEQVERLLLLTSLRLGS